MKDLSSFESVCVLVPCYNGMPYILEALDSALAQTLRPAQIVVVDDGSKDNSAAAVREYAALHKDFDIQLVPRTNGGEPAARNTGIAAARTTWVAMLDSDDWWDPRKLEKQVAAAKVSGGECVLVHTGVVHHFPDGHAEEKDLAGPARRTGWCTAALLEPASIGHPSIMVRRDALAKINGYDESFKQACDIDLYFRLSVVGAFAFVPEHLLHYRIHAGQMSKSPVEQIRHHHRAVRNFFESQPAWREKLGPGVMEAALAKHVAIKLESLYWRRQLPAFRDLLAFAHQTGLHSTQIDHWRGKARWPDWAIGLKDRMGGAEKKEKAKPQAAVAEQTFQQPLPVPSPHERGGEVDLTVAICTYRRPEVLRVTLESLAAARPPACAWELIVVDNGCEEAAKKVAGSFAGRLPLRYEQEPVAGTSNARNHAVRSARGSVVLFTDDDVVFDAQWLCGMAHAVAEHPECDFWGGRVEPVWPAQAHKPNWFDEARAPMMGDVIVQYRRGETGREWDPRKDPPFYTANLALRKSRVAEAGFFDVTVGHRGTQRMGMEDSLMVRAISRRGGRGWYAGEAVVQHPVPMERMNKKYFRDFAWRQGVMSIRTLREENGGRVPRWLYRSAMGKTFGGGAQWLGGTFRGDAAGAFAGQFAMVFNVSKLWHTLQG